MNTVTLIGNLATDVDLKELEKARSWRRSCWPSIEPTKDGAADFVRVYVWDRQASSATSTWRRATPVGVEGRLREPARGRTTRASGERRSR